MLKSEKVVLEGELDAVLEQAGYAPNNVEGAKFNLQADQKEDDLDHLNQEIQEKKEQISKLAVKKWIEKMPINPMSFRFTLYKNSNK